MQGRASSGSAEFDWAYFQLVASPSHVLSKSRLVFAATFVEFIASSTQRTLGATNSPEGSSYVGRLGLPGPSFSNEGVPSLSPAGSVMHAG